MRIMLLTTLLVAGTTLAAQAPPFTWGRGELGPLFQNRTACVKDSQGFGLGAGHWFTTRWGAEATYIHASLKNKDGLWKAGEHHLDTSLLYRPFQGWGPWIPFLRGGLGASKLQAPLSLSPHASTRLNLMAGIGAQVLMGPQALGTVELRSVTVESSLRRQETQLMVGGGWRWGLPAPKAAPLTPPTPPTVEAPPPPPAAPAPEPVPEPAPELLPVPVAAPEPVPAPAALPKKIILSEAVLHFPNNGHVLAADATLAIQTVAEQLKAYPGQYTLVVGGHTSSLGPLSHNKALSLRRAQAVAAVLVAAGIPADRVRAVGHGPSKPIANNKSRRGQSQNRRVEIDIQTPEQVEKTRTEIQPVVAPAVKSPRRQKPKKP